MAETNKTLLIGDSQLRNVQINEIDVQYKSGLCTDSMLTEINKATLAQYDQIILWVGGNDAYPRHRNYDLTKTKRQFQNAMTHIKGDTEASIVIVSATRRSKDPHRRIRTINVALAELASKNKASFCNAYAKFAKPTDLRDGVHLTTEAKDKFVGYLERYLTQAPKGGPDRFSTRMAKKKAVTEPSGAAQPDLQQLRRGRRH